MQTTKMENISKYAVVIAVTLGIGMIVLGSIFIFMGLDARGEVRDALVKEHVITSDDAPIPGVLVEDAATAKAQQDAIESHTFGRWGALQLAGPGRGGVRGSRSGGAGASGGGQAPGHLLVASKP